MTNCTTKEAPSNAATAARKAEVIRYAIPPVAISEDTDGYTIEAELPGVAKEGVRITVENGELTFTGAKRRLSEGARIHVELEHADYRRVFDLDPAVDTGKITAKMDQGLLTLRLPKAEDKKPRNISVEG